MLVGRYIPDFARRLAAPSIFWASSWRASRCPPPSSASRPGVTARSCASPGPLLVTALVFGLLYVWHARRAAHPVLDLSLLAIPTFRLSFIGGSLTRITQGAQPFLLPLMMQLAFGLTPRRVA